MKRIGWLPSEEATTRESNLNLQTSARDIHRVAAGGRHVLSHWSEAELHQWVEMSWFSGWNVFDLLCIAGCGALVWRCAGFAHGAVAS